MFVWFFFWDFWGLFGREPPLLAVGARAGSGRGAGLGRVRAVWDAPRGCTPDWRTSAPSPDRVRVSRRGSRAGRSAALFGVWRKTRPSHGGSSFSPRRGGSRAGSRATRRTVLPRGSRGMRGGRTGGVRFGGGGVRFGWVEERRRALNVCEGSSWSHAAFSKCAAGARRVDAGILNGTGVDRRDATGRPRDEDRRERGHLATFLTPRNLRVFWHPSQRDEFSVQFPPHASNRRGGASDVSRWPRGMDTTHPTAHENASIVPRGTLPTRPRPAPSRSDGRRSRGCPATTH